MPTFQGGNGAFTPTTTQDNWTLDTKATAGVFGKIVEIGWGGSLATSTGYRTRWTKPGTVGSSTFTSLNPVGANPQYNTPTMQLGTFATAPVLQADPGFNLWAQNWNGQGGVGVIVLPLANPWWLVNAATTGQVSCRQVTGTDASGSSFHVGWEE